MEGGAGAQGAHEDYQEGNADVLDSNDVALHQVNLLVPVFSRVRVQHLGLAQDSTGRGRLGGRKLCELLSCALGGGLWDDSTGERRETVSRWHPMCSGAHPHGGPRTVA